MMEITKTFRNRISYAAIALLVLTNSPITRSLVPTILRNDILLHAITISAALSLYWSWNDEIGGKPY